MRQPGGWAARTHGPNQLVTYLLSIHYRGASATRQPTVKAMRWRAPAVRPALSSRYFWRHPALFLTSSRVIRVAARTAAGFISGTGRFSSPGRIERLFDPFRTDCEHI